MSRTLLVGLPLLMFAAVLQSTVLTYWKLGDGTLDLTLILAISWTLAGDWQGGAVWGFIGGLCLDLLSGGPWGAAAFSMVLMAYLASLTEGRFWRSHILLPLATAGLTTVGYYLVYMVILTITGTDVDWLNSLVRVILPAALLNTLAILPLYHALRWVRGIVYPVEVKDA